MINKKQALYELAKQRMSDNSWPGYYSIADFHNGIYECNYVSPNTKSAENLNASVFVMMQDWSSTDDMKKPICWDSVNFGHTLSAGSNVNLKKLLHEHLELELSETYATNLFPFIKPGKKNAHIPHLVMQRAAIEYGLPQIRIIKPKLVICFGIDTFNALRTAVGLSKVGTVNDGIDCPFLFEGIEFWLQTHTCQQAQNFRNKHGVNRVGSDWQKMARRLKL